MKTERSGQRLFGLMNGDGLTEHAGEGVWLAVGALGKHARGTEGHNAKGGLLIRFLVHSDGVNVGLDISV